EHRMFESKSLPARLVIMVAGVTMNVLLALVILTGLALRSGDLVLRTRVIGAVRDLPGLPALRSGLSSGDTIYAIDERPVDSWNDVMAAIDEGTSDTVAIRTNRGEVSLPLPRGSASRDALIGAIQPYLPPVVDEVVPDRAAAVAGLRPGDSVVAVNGAPVRSWGEVVFIIERSPGRALSFEVARRGSRQTLRVRPDSTPQPNAITGAEEIVGKIGASRRESVLEERRPLPFDRAVATGWNNTWRLTALVIDFVRQLFTGEVSLRGVGGPITIARASAEAARSGLDRLLQLTAFLSINLAVLNLLPIPILDGGQIVLNIVESARGTAFSVRTREYILRFGLLIILLIFSLAMYNDITSWVRNLVDR
ncbi:MAG: RIP metalloprotease RseP, partial [Gemmatimonadaceae bacterium]